MRHSIQPSVPAGHPASMEQETSLSNLLRELRMRESNQTPLVGASMGSALEAIWANRTRSLLTMLGIVIGITAVIGALTLTRGVGTYIDNAILGQGANTIYIAPHNSPGPLSQQVRPLTIHDLQSLSNLPHVAAISPVTGVGGQVTYGNQNWRTNIEGVSTDMQIIENRQVARGLWFSSTQQAGSEPVAVISDTVAQNLFGASGANPVGKNINMFGQIFRVVGVLAPQGVFSRDDVIFVPYETLQARLFHDPNHAFDEIDVEADSQNNLSLVQQEITTVLEVNHHIPFGGHDDFDVSTSVQIIQQVDQNTQVITNVLTGIATISLTVAGIGIMNIMLVSVTERTREIGIRMSVGARRRDIRNQFLIEALFLCLLGGTVGLLLGVLVGWLMVGVVVGFVVEPSASGQIPLVITPATLILPFAVSAGVGIIFGLYPAIRASRLDPIVALRRAR